MTRWSLGTLLATVVAGPWGGCDREPVTPPAMPPAERAPVLGEQPDRDGLGSIILLDERRRRG